MISLISLTVVAVSFLTLLGLPIAMLISRKLPLEFRRGAFLIACSLLVGFGIISISAAWSFGFFGVDSFGILCLALGFIPSVVLLVSRIKNPKPITKFVWDKFDFGIGLLFPLSALVNRIHIDSELGLGFRSGNGPDTAQNLMSFVGLRSRGETWISLNEYFQKDIETSSLYQGLNDIYTAFSFQAQAVYDYLLYGTRWGLSVPASFANDLFGKHPNVDYRNSGPKMVCFYAGKP